MQDFDLLSGLAYLSKHFVDARSFARQLQVEEGELPALIDAEVLPQASHRVHCPQVVFASAHFGEEELAPQNLEFWPMNLHGWLSPFVRAYKREGIEASRDLIFSAFSRELGSAEAQLAIRHPEISFPDLVTKSWVYWLGGVYGVCIADFSRPEQIAHKKFAMAQLETELALRRVGDPDWESRVAARQETFSKVASPFAPWDYPKSSRKRLIDQALSEA